VNAAYRNHCQIKDTVWKNYRLVAIQWPLPPGNVLDQFFPSVGVANVTMETYHQTSGCINCHGLTSSVKFVFYPQLRARDVNAGPTDAAPAAVESVRRLIKKEADRRPRK
jgi:hypothetical protein